MGLDVVAVAGFGVTIPLDPYGVDNWAQIEKPDWLKWEAFGVYEESTGYLLGAVYTADYRREQKIGGRELPLFPDILPAIVEALTQVTYEGQPLSADTIDEALQTYGFHVYNHVF